MNLLRCLLPTWIMFSFTYAEEMSINYQRMDESSFNQIVIGSTVVGKTRQSHSLYLLYFQSEGVCQLWKAGQVFVGSWWIGKDETGEEYVHAVWPNYTSSFPESLFSPQHPCFGNATSIKYYYNSKTHSLLLVGKTWQANALLFPGKAF